MAAVDLGAESGRVATVAFDGTRLALDVVHRFTHQPRDVDGIVRWDLEQLWGGVQHGLGRLAAGATDIASVGADAWGVDYGLLDAHGALLDDPTCYRDDRQPRARARAVAAVGVDRIYTSTGVQVIDINTLFALVADATEHPERLERAARLVMMPDVFHHLLSGSDVTELTAASTTGFYDMAQNRWATELLDDLGVPTHFLPEVVPPGTDVGPLLPHLGTGRLVRARVVMPPGHDTASAVVGTPLHDPGSLYISSGTWSLVGIEVAAPVISAGTRAANLTNEGGYDGTTRLLRNVTGLWVLQSCRRWWQRQGVELTYPELVALAAEAPGPARPRQPRRPRVPRRPAHTGAHPGLLRPHGHPGAAVDRGDHPLRRRLAGAGLPARGRGPRRRHRSSRPEHQRRRRRGQQHAAGPAHRRRLRRPGVLRARRGHRPRQRRDAARGPRRARRARRHPSRRRRHRAGHALRTPPRGRLGRRLRALHRGWSPGTASGRGSRSSDPRSDPPAPSSTPSRTSSPSTPPQETRR